MNKKIAKLVTVEITTRVLVDANPMPECEEEDAMTKAIDKIKRNINDMVCWDNVTEIADDKECPYGTFKDDMDSVLRCQLFGLYEMAADYIGDNKGCYIANHIINEGANLLFDNLEVLEAYDSIFEVLTKCVYFINMDFDHELTLAEYADKGPELVEEISGVLGEFFDE